MGRGEEEDWRAEESGAPAVDGARQVEMGSGGRWGAPILVTHATEKELAHEELARIFHESLTTTADMAVLPGVLGSRPLRRTEQVRLRFESRATAGRLHGGTAIFAVSRHQFMNHPG